MTSSLLLNWLFLFDKLCFCSVFFQNKSTQSLLVIRHIFRELNRRPADDDDDGDDEDYQHQSGFKKIKTLHLFVFFLAAVRLRRRCYVSHKAPLLVCCIHGNARVQSHQRERDRNSVSVLHHPPPPPLPPLSSMEGSLLQTWRSEQRF